LNLSRDYRRFPLIPTGLAQVLGNLITNSLRYTPEGGEIKLLARQEAQTVQLIVADNGKGISPEAFALHL